MADQAFLLHIANDAELLVARNFGVDAMQLPQIDPIKLEATQAHVDATCANIPAAQGLPAYRGQALVKPPLVAIRKTVIWVAKASAIKPSLTAGP